jgi:predicted transcriptional regulator
MSERTFEASGIAYQASLPLCWRELDAPTVSELLAWRYANIALLRGLATLEVASSDLDHEADTPQAKALERLESKLDIALSMLARVTTRDISMPPPQAITLRAERIEWASDQPLPAEGREIAISLYLSPRLPEPLQLHARVVDATPHRCIATLLDDEPEFEEWMTRTLFRYHRRGLQARHLG